MLTTTDQDRTIEAITIELGADRVVTEPWFPAGLKQPEEQPGLCRFYEGRRLLGLTWVRSDGSLDNASVPILRIASRLPLGIEGVAANQRRSAR